MAPSGDLGKYDEVLTSILVNEKSIVGFMSTIFNFLARRTDFYYIPQDPSENMGFPPGVAEELVVKVLRACDPKNWKPPNGASKPYDISNEIMCSTVAQEVEVIADEDEVEHQSDESIQIQNLNIQDQNSSIQNENINQDHQYSLPSTSAQFARRSNPDSADISSEQAEDVAYPEQKPPLLPTQQNSETYNGAEFENYCWAQTITDVDITAKLPPHVKSSKDLRVIIDSEHISVRLKNGDILFEDSLQYKVKTMDSFWSISGGKLLIHLEKVVERWWNKFLDSEEGIDLSRIDCSRPLYDLPADHIAKIHEIQFNQQQKMLGLPTSDQLRNIEIMRKAWDADGSPFKGQQFNPDMFQ